MSDNLKFLQDYESWKIEKRLNSIMDSPENYLAELQAERNKAILDDALAFLERYELSPWPKDLVESMARILRDEKE